MIVLEKNTDNRKTKATVNFDFVNLNNTISHDVNTSHQIMSLITFIWLQNTIPVHT